MKILSVLANKINFKWLCCQKMRNYNVRIWRTHRQKWAFLIKMGHKLGRKKRKRGMAFITAMRERERENLIKYNWCKYTLKIQIIGNYSIILEYNKWVFTHLTRMVFCLNYKFSYMITSTFPFIIEKLIEKRMGQQTS